MHPLLESNILIIEFLRLIFKYFPLVREVKQQILYQVVISTSSIIIAAAPLASKGSVFIIEKGGGR